MASLTIRNLDNSLKEQLRQQAARHGRSMEAEARSILSLTLTTGSTGQDLALSIHKRFRGLELDELPIPTRQITRNTPEFD